MSQFNIGGAQGHGLRVQNLDNNFEIAAERSKELKSNEQDLEKRIEHLEYIGKPPLTKCITKTSS